MTDRLLAGLHGRGPITLDRHRAIHGPLPDAGPDLIATVEAAGLRGRGGGGFPAAVKLAAVAEARRRPVVVVNGTEGEPMSAKDRALMRHTPHLVLDGAISAARAVGARDVLVAAPPDSAAVLAGALSERGELGSRHTPRITLTASAVGYVAGEETAVLAHLEGRPPLPRVTPPRPAQSGFRGRPTLVQNVETLAHLGLIARHGAAWFREAGTAARPGTMLVTVSGAVRAPGVHEVPVGTSLPEVLDRAGGATEPPTAFLVGGYFGAWVRPDAVGLALDDAVLRAHGAAVGAGVVVALGASSCPVAETARLATYLAAESAGQCGPCFNGLPAIAAVVERFATARTVRGDGERLTRWIDMVKRRGACAHPDGFARMLETATRVFRDDFEEHARTGRCARCHADPVLLLPRPARAAATA
ncbi:MAG TPA: NADH-ubiquinone oxidoreductase-F iron-sulfur binding region domain-containing protein [Baekduia sp.]|nr:NADH-ubiquinone oxidoreductase-F iron-sulfur binding region domain-containing protein [Baekduia sp.]